MRRKYLSLFLGMTPLLFAGNSYAFGSVAALIGSTRDTSSTVSVQFNIGSSSSTYQTFAYDLPLGGIFMMNSTAFIPDVQKANVSVALSENGGAYQPADCNFTYDATSSQYMVVKVGYNSDSGKYECSSGLQNTTPITDNEGTFTIKNHAAAPITPYEFVSYVITAKDNDTGNSHTVRTGPLAVNNAEIEYNYQAFNPDEFYNGTATIAGTMVHTGNTFECDNLVYGMHDPGAILVNFTDSGAWCEYG